MSKPTAPLFVVYVVWHEEFEFGKDIATAIHSHFRRDLPKELMNGYGIDVVFRYGIEPDSTNPREIDFDGAEMIAVVALVDSNLANDSNRMEFIHGLASRTEAIGHRTRLFPVVCDEYPIEKLNLKQQAIRWNNSDDESEASVKKLMGSLTHAFCRLLRNYLMASDNQNQQLNELNRYTLPIRVFLSHARRDPKGLEIAEAIRKQCLTRSLASFLDIYDIPPGEPFDKVLFNEIEQNAMMTIYTDSYSSREWCCREVLEAKRHNVPYVVVNGLVDIDERAFPYLGNVPTIRIDKIDCERLDFIIDRLNSR